MVGEVEGGVVPEKHFYFSIGAVVGSAICVVVAKKRHALRKTSAFFQWLYRKDPHWFLYFPIVIFMVGLWGLIPPIQWGHLASTEVLYKLYKTHPG